MDCCWILKPGYPFLTTNPMVDAPTNRIKRGHLFFFFVLRFIEIQKKNHIVQTIYICTDTNMGCYRNFFQRCRRPFKGLTINHIHIHAVASGTFPWESLSSDN